MRVEHNVMINRPIEEVFSYTTNPDTLTQWNTAAIDVTVAPGTPAGVGAIYHLKAQFLGRRLDSSSEVTEYEPPRKIVYKTRSGPIPMHVRYTFEPASGGTQVTEVIDGEPGGFFRLADPVLKRLVERQVESSLKNLKDLLEAQA
jgi:uncharacterized protein YndB with AHSA1/START domain